MAWIVEQAGLGPGRVVVDLGAGTGKLTRLLIQTGARVVAVEPVREMRAKLSETSPGAEVLDGTAESLPLADLSADAITVAQAFHWFDHDAALPQLHRVLRLEGTLVPPAERDQLLARARALAYGLPEPFPFRYRTDVYAFPRSSDQDGSQRRTSRGG